MNTNKLAEITDPKKIQFPHVWKDSSLKVVCIVYMSRSEYFGYKDGFMTINSAVLTKDGGRKVEFSPYTEEGRLRDMGFKRVHYGDETTIAEVFE
jgi:hypothetical protein